MPTFAVRDHVKAPHPLDPSGDLWEGRVTRVFQSELGGRSVEMVRIQFFGGKSADVRADAVQKVSNRR